MITLACLMRPDFDAHRLAEVLEKIQKLIGRESAEVSVHQMRNLRLGNPKKLGNGALFKLLGLKDFVNVKANFGAHEQLVRLLQAQVGVNIAAAFFDVSTPSSSAAAAHTHTLACTVA